MKVMNLSLMSAGTKAISLVVHSSGDSHSRTNSGLKQGKGGGRSIGDAVVGMKLPYLYQCLYSLMLRPLLRPLSSAPFGKPLSLRLT